MSPPPARPTRRIPRLPLPLGVALVLAGAIPAPTAAQVAPPLGSADLEALGARPVGPAVTGGRVTDIEALPDDPSTIWVATASGGLWRTTNRGHRWTNTFEEMPVSAFGAVAVAPSNPSVVYAGTGEQNNRQSTSWGNGVYRSDDAGESWSWLGLEATRHVGAVRVHPRDPDVAYVAALGDLWAPNRERGVFRTRDGGASWEKVLYVDTLTGAVDLAMDPSDPDILYAATYQRLRRTWGFNGGGPGSGIWKTTDGGERWERLENGLPAGDVGRIGVAVAATDPSVVMATVETAEGATRGTYRSEDGGESWTRVNELNPRPMYYSHIFIDPTDDQRVYVLATSAYVSRNGGRTFREFAETPTYDVGVHADHHALWIDPADPAHFYLGGDAGLWETYDGGGNFRKVNNFPTGQFYAVGVDMRDPYRIYGGMQDNHSWMGPSETRSWIGIVADDWRQVGFSDGMHWDVDPTNHRFAYGSSQGGNYFRTDPETGDLLNISPEAPPGEEYRFDWTSPLMVSRHDPRRVYVAGNRLFSSPDRGSTWARTEDLSRRIDRDTLELMGVPGARIRISPNDGTSSFGEATTLSESPLDPSVLWVGFDDGNLQLSRDMGESWTEVSANVPGLPDGTYVSRVVASRRAPGVAWATFDGHRDGDLRPYVYRTEDFGRSWSPRVGGLPEGSVNALAEHPDDPDVLFLGTEHHAWASVDGGASWARMAGLPTAPYDDIVVHPREKDLVLGTHGRSIWIVDDTRPLAEWNEAAGPLHLFSVAPATLFHYWKDTSYRGQAEWHGRNPPDGALVTYRVAGGGIGDLALTVRDEAGRVVRTLEVPSSAGTHRVSWDLRHALPGSGPERWEAFEHDELTRPIEERGPLVSPGSYSLSLTAGDGTAAETRIEVRGDPLLELTTAEYRDRERFLLEVARLAADIDELRSRAGRRGGSGSRDAALPLDLVRAGRTVDGIYRDLVGSGARQGSLHPPTESDRLEIARARRTVDEARGRLDR